MLRRPVTRAWFMGFLVLRSCSLEPKQHKRGDSAASPGLMVRSHASMASRTMATRWGRPRPSRRPLRGLLRVRAERDFCGSGRQCHTFLRGNGGVHRLADMKFRLGLGTDADFAVAGVDEIVDHLAQEHPVRDLAGERVEAI